jgi:hypothetical protein
VSGEAALPSRPFVVPTSAGSKTIPDVQAQLEAAQKLRRFSAIVRASSRDAFPTDKMHQLKSNEQRPNQTGLPDRLKVGIESLSGISLDDVKVHYNSSKPAQLNALAFAQGSNIHVAPGQEQHLPHEAWHLVQQAQGRVKPTMQMKNGVPINCDKRLEREADIMGAKALTNTARLIGERTNPLFNRAALPLQAKSLSTKNVAQLWHRVKGQDGEFEGDESAHHLHRVGGDEHYRYGDKRVNYMHTGVANYFSIVSAIEACEVHPSLQKSGQEACLIYLRQLLRETPKPKEVPKESTIVPNTPKSKGRNKKLGNKKVTDNRVPKDDLFGDFKG